MKINTEFYLEHFALLKIAARLWNIAHETHSVGNDWHAMENIIIQNVDKICLPKLLLEKVKIFVRISGVELYKFWISLKYITFNKMEVQLILSYVCWTTQGTIDTHNTCKLLAKEENLTAFIRFKIACLYCVESCVTELWKYLSEIERNLLYRQYSRGDIIHIWSFKMADKTEELQSREYGSHFRCYNSFAAMSCLDQHNIDAAHFFLEKVSATNKETVLDLSLNDLENNFFDFPTLYNYFSSSLYFTLPFLFSDLTTNLVEYLKVRAFVRISRILVGFLEWPHQSNFLKVVEFFQPYIREEEYVSTIRAILYKINNNFKDYDYHSLKASLENMQHTKLSD